VGLPEAARAFDELSSVYDATRAPPNPATIAAVRVALGDRAVARLLEVGVGTGRFAIPLRDAGLDVVGVDAARNMLARAVAKGFPSVVRGSAYRLPFADRTFDAALFVHVLHIVERPAAALREAVRVGTIGAFALLTPSSDPARAPDPEDPIRLLVRDLAEQGYRLERTPRAPGRQEAELLVAIPPDETLTVSDTTVTEPVTRRLDMAAQRASRHFRDVPAELLDPAVARVRARVGARTRTFRKREVLAWWRPDHPVARADGSGPEPVA